MFRQVVMFRWAPEAGQDQRRACLEAFETLREIPELLAQTVGADGGYFEGNHDVVAVMDFADFAAARRYVADPRHHDFITGHVRPSAVDRTVVQHAWQVGDACGLHHVKVPVSDVAVSRDWYLRAFGLVVEREFPDGTGGLSGVALRHPLLPLRLAVRRDAQRAAALAGFDLVALHVATREDLAAVLGRLDAGGIAYGETVAGRPGVLTVDVADPDGILVRLYCDGASDSAEG